MFTVTKETQGEGSSMSVDTAAKAPTGTKTVLFKIKRQADPNSAAQWEGFEIRWKPGMNVISSLMEIAANPVTTAGVTTSPVTYDANCLEEVCGSCAMVINGKARMACSALVDQLEQPIRVEPLTKFPVVRDLAVDRSVIFENLKAVKAWVPAERALVSPDGASYVNGALTWAGYIQLVDAKSGKRRQIFAGARPAKGLQWRVISYGNEGIYLGVYGGTEVPEAGPGLWLLDLSTGQATVDGTAVQAAAVDGEVPRAPVVKMLSLPSPAHPASIKLASTSAFDEARIIEDMGSTPERGSPVCVRFCAYLLSPICDSYAAFLAAASFAQAPSLHLRRGKAPNLWIRRAGNSAGAALPGGPRSGVSALRPACARGPRPGS
jgi:hypothetical protein